MQLNFEKRNLKNCNGSLRFIRKGSKLHIFYAILCLCCNYNCNFSQKKRFSANILCNFGYKLQLNAILFKKRLFSYFFHENNNFKKHEIAIKILII